MSHSARVAANTAIDTAMATIVSNIPSWITVNGGNASIMVRSLVATLAAADPTLGRYIERHFGVPCLTWRKSKQP